MFHTIILHILLALVGLQPGHTVEPTAVPAARLHQEPDDRMPQETVVGLHPGAPASRSTADADTSKISTQNDKEQHSQAADRNTPQITLEEYREAEATVGNPESEVYDEEAFCQVIRKALDADILGEADKMRAHYRLEIAAKNRPGTIASDFRFIDRDDDDCTLHSIKTEKPILLIFYDPDCDHCMQAIARLRDTDLTKRTQIVAIYAEEDRERWEETAPSLPDGWIVGCATDPIQDEETYVFLSSPTIFLLDKGKKVILKDTALDVVEKAIPNP